MDPAVAEPIAALLATVALGAMVLIGMKSATTRHSACAAIERVTASFTTRSRNSTERCGNSARSN